MDKSEDKDVGIPSHYIGIGASAGGLEALQTLLQNLPVDTGACFVIVQHLSPDFKSMMLELLSKHTQMQIENVTDGVLTKRNTIYLLPPKKSMIVAQGELILTDKIPETGLSLPIDVFFRSLAEDQQHRAIGIILSGTGSDGTRGLKALKEAGALVIAQEPDSAKFDGMPNSAINTGIVDLILRPEEMGKQLASYIQHPLVSGQTEITSDSNLVTQDLMAEIFDILRLKSDIDFSKYKAATITRRIERRMTIKQLTSLQDYLTLLFKDSYEVEVLGKELLIGVTRFFRDTEAFTYLKDFVIPKIVSESSSQKVIRAWVAACSSGEEAYSIAIMFEEEIRKQGIEQEVKVFATDVNADAIAEASAGFYSADIENDINSNLLKRHFVKVNTGGYQVSQKIRHSVVFATHNMLIDPPFSNIDFVSCRNALIYLKPNAQQRVLSSFHFALNKLGYLFLGSSENLGDLSVHFNAVNERQKIFMKTGDVKLPLSSSTSDSPKASRKDNHSMPSVSDLMKSYKGNSNSVGGLGFVNDALISEFVAPCILLNDEYQAIHVYGDTTPYVRRLPPGRISTLIKDMVNEDISIAVSSALQRAKYSGEEVCYTGMTTQGREDLVNFDLRARYIKEHDLVSSPGYYWVLFDTVKSDSKGIKNSSEKFDVSEQARQRIADLELELKYNKEHLQVTVEELETTNEELQSANEELMSANEELQSTNEELQSVNEELYTVNSEYQEKIVQISQANGDLDEVLGLSKIGIIFVDDKLLIRRYTEAVKTYINLQEADISRPLHHISNNIEYDTMLVDVATVLSTTKSIEKEITLKDKKLLRISINSYNYSDVSRSKGVAITFLDISRVRYMELGMVVAYKQLRSSINNALEILDTKPFTQQLNVIILDDSAAYLELLESQLSQINEYQINIFKCSNVKQAFSLIRKNDIDICICDYYLKDETALNLIDGLTHKEIVVPVIVITGDKSDELTPLLLSHGALDLIDKDELSPALLDRSIRYAIRRHQIDLHIEELIENESNTIEGK
ncbi:chemotaxis protein CheB [Glaciecola sp. 2405UD65-10]|uniref:chemotaxis protein CheB n=1 Tax=Glaciecola sp. 2405UD65-10 TaxID=3397244 RepID=UPI003B5A1036